MKPLIDKQSMDPRGIKELGEMRTKPWKLMLVILGLVVATCFGAAATSALASPEWVNCVKLEGGGFENSSCLKEKSKGGWEWQEVTSTEKIKFKGTLGLKDTKTLAGTAEVICSTEGIGAAGPEKFGRITEVKTSAAQCSAIKICENVEAAEARNLPWQTELYETEEAIPQKLMGTGSGEPGWKITCKTPIGKITDECTLEPEKAESLEDINTESVVLAKLQHSRKSKCTEGGAESGELNGKMRLEGSNGGIAVQTVYPTWFVNVGGQLGRLVGSETTLVRSVLGKKLQIKSNAIEVECEKTTTGSGSITFKNQIEVANMTLEKCTVPFPEQAGFEKCKVEGEKIPLNRQSGHAAWKEATGEGAVLYFSHNSGVMGGVTAEFKVEKEGALECSVSGTYKMTGEFIAELKNSTTEETHKKYLLPCPTPITNEWLGAAPNRSRYTFLFPLKLDKGAATEAAKFCGENEFTLNGPLNGNAFRTMASP
jgi:hypothetical protein